MTRSISTTIVTVADLTATDLKAEAERATGTVTAMRGTVYDDDASTPEAVQILYDEDSDRIGIAWGADAVWGDARGDARAAIEDWLHNAEEWEARA